MMGEVMTIKLIKFYDVRWVIFYYIYWENIEIKCDSWSGPYTLKMYPTFDKNDHQY